jgi:hypothetical protein
MRFARPKQATFGTRIPALGGDIVAAKSFSRGQALYNEKASQYAKQGIITTPSYLRLEQTATAVATSIINFNTLDTSGTKTVTERRLKLNDTICDDSSTCSTEEVLEIEDNLDNVDNLNVVESNEENA